CYVIRCGVSKVFSAFVEGLFFFFFFSSRRRHTRSYGDWSSDVCSSDLWKWKRHLEGDPSRKIGNQYHYPSVMQAKDGSIHVTYRSEERRVGKECRSRRWR